MPAKNTMKIYIENGYYHIYNRGVEKRVIFQDRQDYGVFLSYLKDYLSPKDEQVLRNELLNLQMPPLERDRVWQKIRMNNFYTEITLLSYCLMPNHFHLFLKQKSKDAINKFMNSLCTRYTMYFNRKYDRVGALYQDTYKAVLVTSDEQFLQLSRYIHKQALSLQGETLQESQPSSYPEYLGLRRTSWVHPEEVLSFFSDTNPTLSYKSFVIDSGDFSSLGNLTIETPVRILPTRNRKERKLS
jgi:putative transposase